jgi:hypothetical protein
MADRRDAGDPATSTPSLFYRFLRFTVRDALPSGTSIVDAERHARVRAGFVDALLNDPRVVERFTLWSRALTSALRSPEDATDREAVVALLHGYRSHVSQYQEWKKSLKRTVRRVRDAKLKLIPEQEALREALRSVDTIIALSDARIATVFDASALVNDLGYPRNWLTAELLTAHASMLRSEMTATAPLIADALSVALGDIHPTNTRVVALHAPRVSVRFATRVDEPLDEAQARWVALRDEIDRKFAEVKVGRSARLGRRGNLEEWGRWYYETRVRKPPATVRALAEARHKAAGHCGPSTSWDCCSKTVRDGIREAEELLALAR